MAKRSARTKVRFQGDKAILKTDSILRHLQYLDEIANGESDYINKSLPVLVKATVLLKDALQKFREGL